MIQGLQGIYEIHGAHKIHMNQGIYRIHGIILSPKKSHVEHGLF